MAVIGAADGVACWACLFGFDACAVGAEIYEICGTWSEADGLDGGFEMLTIFHGASPDSEMFASD